MTVRLFNAEAMTFSLVSENGGKPSATVRHYGISGSDLEY